MIANTEQEAEVLALGELILAETEKLLGRAVPFGARFDRDDQSRAIAMTATQAMLWALIRKDLNPFAAVHGIGGAMGVSVCFAPEAKNAIIAAIIDGMEKSAAHLERELTPRGTA